MASDQANPASESGAQDPQSLVDASPFDASPTEAAVPAAQPDASENQNQDQNQDQAPAASAAEAPSAETAGEDVPLTEVPAAQLAYEALESAADSTDDSDDADSDDSDSDDSDSQPAPAQNDGGGAETASSSSAAEAEQTPQQADHSSPFAAFSAVSATSLLFHAPDPEDVIAARERAEREREEARLREAQEEEQAEEAEYEDPLPEAGVTSKRRRRRRRGSEDMELIGGDEGDPEQTVTRIRTARVVDGSAPTTVQSVKGSTRLEAKKQRRRESRQTGRRRQVITEAEFLARRESVERQMVVRQKNDRIQIGVLEDGVLAEHFVSHTQQDSLIGSVYLGKVQNVLPSMEAAFVDIGRGRNAVLYAGEVNWDKADLGGGAKRIENALKPGDPVLVQATKDPVGHKGARLTSQISLPGRYLVYVPGGSMTGISRKLPDVERQRLKKILKDHLPEGAGVIVRTAAEGASEQELTNDINRLRTQWEQIQEKAAQGKTLAPELLYSEPDLTIKTVRDVFNEDFTSMIVQGEQAWDSIEAYVMYVAPDLLDRVHKWDQDEDLFAHFQVDDQIFKALERKVLLPSGGSLVIDRTEAMTVVDVNTGKFTGSGGNLEETVTKNNLEAAEEIVRQLRLRDIGGIIVIDFIDMVLEANRDLVLRRLVECLGRDRTKHQVAEVTSLGLVQMTRKRMGTGLLEVFSEDCEACDGRGVVVHDHPLKGRSTAASEGRPQRGDRNERKRGRRLGGSSDEGSRGGSEQRTETASSTQQDPEQAKRAAAARSALAAIAQATHHDAAAPSEAPEQAPATEAEQSQPEQSEPRDEQEQQSQQEGREGAKRRRKRRGKRSRGRSQEELDAQDASTDAQASEGRAAASEPSEAQPAQAEVTGSPAAAEQGADLHDAAVEEGSAAEPSVEAEAPKSTGAEEAEAPAAQAPASERSTSSSQRSGGRSGSRSRSGQGGRDSEQGGRNAGQNGRDSRQGGRDSGRGGRGRGAAPSLGAPRSEEETRSLIEARLRGSFGDSSAQTESGPTTSPTAAADESTQPTTTSTDTAPSESSRSNAGRGRSSRRSAAPAQDRSASRGEAKAPAQAPAQAPEAAPASATAESAAADSATTETANAASVTAAPVSAPASSAGQEQPAAGRRGRRPRVARTGVVQPSAVEAPQEQPSRDRTADSGASTRSAVSGAATAAPAAERPQADAETPVSAPVTAQPPRARRSRRAAAPAGTPQDAAPAPVKAAEPSERAAVGGAAAVSTDDGASRVTINGEVIELPQGSSAAEALRTAGETPELSSLASTLGEREPGAAGPRRRPRRSRRASAPEAAPQPGASEAARSVETSAEGSTEQDTAEQS